MSRILPQKLLLSNCRLTSEKDTANEATADKYIAELPADKAAADRAVGLHDGRYFVGSLVSRRVIPR